MATYRGMTVSGGVHEPNVHPDDRARDRRRFDLRGVEQRRVRAELERAEIRWTPFVSVGSASCSGTAAHLWLRRGRQGEQQQRRDLRVLDHLQGRVNTMRWTRASSPRPRTGVSMLVLASHRGMKFPALLVAAAALPSLPRRTPLLRGNAPLLGVPAGHCGAARTLRRRGRQCRVQRDSRDVRRGCSARPACLLLAEATEWPVICLLRAPPTAHSSAVNARSTSGRTARQARRTSWAGRWAARTAGAWCCAGRRRAGACAAAAPRAPLFSTFGKGQRRQRLPRAPDRAHAWLDAAAVGARLHPLGRCIDDARGDILVAWIRPGTVEARDLVRLLQPAVRGQDARRDAYAAQKLSAPPRRRRCVVVGWINQCISEGEAAKGSVWPVAWMATKGFSAVEQLDTYGRNTLSAASA